jgi:hypothetical protein
MLLLTRQREQAMCLDIKDEEEQELAALERRVTVSLMAACCMWQNF